MAEVVERIRIHHACSVCGKAWLTKRITEAHVAEGCIHDPATRACATCPHDQHIEGYLYECALNVDKGGLVFVRHCPKWEPRR